LTDGAAVAASGDAGAAAGAAAVAGIPGVPGAAEACAKAAPVPMTKHKTVALITEFITPSLRC
jgi:hypothetical protein